MGPLLPRLVGANGVRSLVNVTAPVAGLILNVIALAGLVMY
jgi:hypothetical protein